MKLPEPASSEGVGNSAQRGCTTTTCEPQKMESTTLDTSEFEHAVPDSASAVPSVEMGTKVQNTEIEAESNNPFNVGSTLRQRRSDANPASARPDERFTTSTGPQIAAASRGGPDGTANTPSFKPPRWFMQGLSIFLVVVISFMYASGRAQRRSTEDVSNTGQPNIVPSFLDSDALQHVELVVGNLTLSSLFYVGVLGARPVVGETNVSAAGPRWQLLSFGNSHVLQLEDFETIQTLRAAKHQRIGVRLGVAADVQTLVQTLEERVKDFGDIRGRVSCGASAVDHERSLLGLVVASCKSVDGESVEFWKPTVDVAKAIDRSRKAWVSKASDPRGRDIFE